MSVPDAAVSSLLDNLSNIIKYNYHMVADVKENIVALHRELESLKALLNDIANYNYDSDNLRQVMKEIRSILYEAEDAVDTYVVHAAVQRSRSWISKAFHQLTDSPIVLRDVRRMIEDVCDKVRKINQEKVEMALQYLPVLDQPERRIIEVSSVEEAHVIGFEEAAEEVSALLTGGPEQFEVISIVGMLGLGKTTLARMVFKHPDVDYEYMIRIFVFVSQEYKKRNVYLKILSSFTPICDEVSMMGEEELQKHVRQQLEGRQYLVVLDDVWDTEDWDKLKDAFPNQKKRCRVLITTRNRRVAEHANPENPDSIYKLDFLKLEESRELLRWRVFHENYCPMELQEYEIQIAEKCGGLPLAIVVIAGILWSHQHRLDWWKDVANNVKDYIARDQEQTSKVIELMYKHLPNCLKPCFLYLGVFSEYFEIPVWKLVQLWIAEGLVQQVGNVNMEDVAAQYLEELVNRNLVMVGQRRSNGKIKTCLLQGTLCQFCRKEATEENFFQEIKKDALPFFLSENPDVDLIRRLCINNVNVLDYISSPSGRRVRSFITFTKEKTVVEPRLVSSIPKTFKLLKVLEVESLLFARFPVHLCHLVLLKYLAISSNFRALPSAVSAMWNLQTLIVNTTSGSLDIRADIWKMTQFRHLHTNVSTSLPYPSPKNQKSKEEPLVGTNIQTLCTISPESCKKEVFDQTPRLKNLSICGELAKLFEVSSESSLFAYLHSLTPLENLKLLNDEKCPRLDSLPSEKSFPRLLKELTLSNTQLEWKEMATLGKLENLEVLKLKNKAFMGKLWQTEKGGFLSLKHLQIGRTDLEVWKASPDDFPLLMSLELWNCNRLQGVPHGFADIPSLQSVVLHCTNPQVASSARRLQVLKLEQARNGNNNSIFKLSVYPPEL